MPYSVLTREALCIPNKLEQKEIGDGGRGRGWCDEGLPHHHLDTALIWGSFTIANCGNNAALACSVGVALIAVLVKVDDDVARSAFGVPYTAAAATAGRVKAPRTAVVAHAVGRRVRHGEAEQVFTADDGAAGAGGTGLTAGKPPHNHTQRHTVGQLQQPHTHTATQPHSRTVAQSHNTAPQHPSHTATSTQPATQPQPHNHNHTATTTQHRQ